MQKPSHHPGRRPTRALPGGLLYAVLTSVLVSSSPALIAGEAAYRSAPLKEKLPAEVSESVRSVVHEEGLRVLGPKGEPYVDIWLRKSVATQDDPKRLARDFGALKDGTLLGVIRFYERTEDFRGDRFKPGLYTFRYAIRPEDGDHQGTSDTLDFVLLCPVDLDAKPEPMPTKEVVKLSVKVSGRKHPSILYLVKMFDQAEKLPRLVHQEEREYWVLDFEVPVEEKSGKAVRAGLVLVGLAPEF